MRKVSFQLLDPAHRRLGSWRHRPTCLPSCVSAQPGPKTPTVQKAPSADTDTRAHWIRKLLARRSSRLHRVSIALSARALPRANSTQRAVVGSQGRRERTAECCVTRMSDSDAPLSKEMSCSNTNLPAAPHVGDAMSLAGWLGLGSNELASQIEVHSRVNSRGTPPG